MNIKQLLCFHKYKKVCVKRNFYGVDELFRCPKCDKTKTDCYGRTHMGGKTTYTHSDLEGNYLSTQERLL